MARFFDLFPPPRFLSMPAPGIALSDSAIRFIDFLPHGNEQRIRAFKTIPLEEGLIVKGRIKKPEQVSTHLSELKNEFNLSYVKATLPEEEAYLYHTTVPPVHFDEVRGAIMSTIEENVPITLPEAVFDFFIVTRDDRDIVPDESDQKALSEQKRIEVAVSVLPREVVEEYLSVFRMAGLSVSHFDVESQAISRALVKAGDRETYLVVTLEEARTILTIVDQENIRFSSVVEVRLAVPQQASTDVVYLKEGDERLITSPHSTVLKDYPGLTEIRNEIKKFYLYWQSEEDKHGSRRSRDARLGFVKVLLVGPIAKDKRISNFLAEELRAKVKVADVWRNSFSLSSYVPSISFEESLSYAPAIGLALSDSSSDRSVEADSRIMKALDKAFKK